MELKFYLNKFVKADNIEGYTIKALYELKQAYDKFIEKTEGLDPDYPGFSFGDKGTSMTKGKINSSEIESDTSGSFNLGR